MRAAVPASAGLARAIMRLQAALTHRLDGRRAVAAGEELARLACMSSRSTVLGAWVKRMLPRTRSARRLPERGCRPRRRSESASPWPPRGRTHRVPGPTCRRRGSRCGPRPMSRGQPLPRQLDQGRDRSTATRAPRLAASTARAPVPQPASSRRLPRRSSGSQSRAGGACSSRPARTVCRMRLTGASEVSATRRRPRCGRSRFRSRSGADR
jgi:hypothetical protein